jgi:poly(A) polymerase
MMTKNIACLNRELTDILAKQDTYNSIIQFDKLGSLQKLVPEIKQFKQSPAKYYFHPKGLWQHSVETLQSAEFILSNMNSLFPGYGEKISGHIKDRVSLLKLIALLHDIGKPSVVKVVDGRPRFFDHDVNGAKLVGKILCRLQYTKKQCAVAEKLVKYHMRPGNLGNARLLTNRAVNRFFRDIGDETIDLLLLSLADRHNYIKHTGREKDYTTHRKFVRSMIKRYFMGKQQTPELPKLVDGNIIMKRFKLKPGPIIGKLLDFVRENQVKGNITTFDEALSLVKKNIDKISQI